MFGVLSTNTCLSDTMLDINSNEKYIYEYWKHNDINQKVKAKNKGIGKQLYFLDGPPYVTGDLHPGHIWVKGLKDLFVRYKRYRGFDVVDRAGYDVHGLPTENAVEKKLKITHKKEIEDRIGIENFIKECRTYIEYYIGRMTNDYERFGISLDFSDPYLPHSNSYIETAWSMLKTAHERGFLYKGSKTTGYCPHCECVVSQGTMEIEHSEERDPSIFVAFMVDTSKSNKSGIKLTKGTYLLVWTTTPWTLPANVAIAVNQNEPYVSARIQGKDYIVAKARLDSVLEALGESAIVTQEFRGSDILGIYYVNALEDDVPKQKELRRYHKVVSGAQFVSVAEGTGLLHVAPGHGLEDYSLGLSLKLPIFSPISPNASYNEDAGKYKGIRVPDEANKAVLEDLERLGVLLKNGTLMHSYPHCWRCHSKVIFIASPQWFLNVQKIKPKLLRENRKIRWHPEEARSWENDILTNSPDWCISRQRYWAIPMPIWVCKECGTITVIGSKSELEESSSNPEYVRSITDLHRPYIDKVVLKCTACGGESLRVLDVMDVWWDSGSAFRASLTKDQFERVFPVEFAVEYIEQIRAWFQYILKVGIFVYGKNPWKHIIVHGILWGSDGRKMSKSFGNFKPLGELVDFATADAYRIWAIGHDPIRNRELDYDDIKDRDKFVIMLYNISNLIKDYSDATDYKPKLKRISRKLEKEEMWIASRFESTKKKITESLDGYEPYYATKAIMDFVIEDLSRFYLKIAKRKILTGSTRQAKSVIDLINHIFFNCLIMMSPIAPFAPEKIYLDHYKFKESIFLEEWPKPDSRLIDKSLEEDFLYVQEAITAILNCREKSRIPLKWPVSDATLEITDDSAYSAIGRFAEIIESSTNSKGLIIKKRSGVNEEVKPAFGKIGPDFKDKAGAVASALKGTDATELRKGVESSGYFLLKTEVGEVRITAEHFTVVQGTEAGDAVIFKYGTAAVNKEITPELKEEALIREIEREVQLSRKKLGLKRPDKIKIGYGSSEDISVVIAKNAKKLKKDLNAISIKEKLIGDDHKEINFEGSVVKISVLHTPS